MNTEVGKIASLLKTTSEKKTPLQVNLDQFGQKLSILILVFCAILFGISVFRGENIGNAFLFAVALAVAAIPEALSSIVTIVLSFGTQKMAKEHAIIRKLQAVEGLGSVSIICSDKTGTLTQNKMTVTEVWTAKEADRSLALTIAALCSDAASDGRGNWSGDPTEIALVQRAAAEGVEKGVLEREMPRRAELPFDSDRKLMTTVHTLPGKGFRIMVKGAPDVLAARCTALPGRVMSINEDMAARALRVLGVAYKDVAFLPRELNTDTLERGLIFVGLLGMIDPPRKEVRAAVERCRAAGVKPVMITGDHKLTAVAIAKQVAESMDKYMKSLPADTTPDPYADIPTFQTPTSDVLGKQEVK